ncbi:Semaphorin-4G, partial [Phoenicopterus ruber ruber]
PQPSVPFAELSGIRRFSARTLNYSTLLLEDDRGILYVGARGAIFALNSSDVADGSHRTIHWEASPEKQMDCLQKGKNRESVPSCLTRSPVPPKDADRFMLPSHFEEGKEKCPYDPARGYTGLIVDGGLYTATRYEFRSLPDIRRNLHQRPLKTEESPLHWLNDAEFVASVLVRESKDSPMGDDDKIYYFFTERASEETTSFFDKSQVARVARVARVCKSDVGGKNILQRKWTSFMKARLVCHIPYYEVLRSVCSLDEGGWASTVFYAAFTLSAQWRTMEASAVCRYSISAVQHAFEGPYMEYQDSARKGGVGWPHPPLTPISLGQCITDRSRRKGYNSSQDLPNSVLDFVKLHPLMFDEVKPAGGEPLLGSLGKGSALAPTSLPGASCSHWHCLELGALPHAPPLKENCAVGLGGISGHHRAPHSPAAPCQGSAEPALFSRRGACTWGQPAGSCRCPWPPILQGPLASCARYASCYDCILARDPYCAWDGRACRATADSWGCTAETPMSCSTGLVQDIQGGNEGCRS